LAHEEKIRRNIEEKSKTIACVITLLLCCVTIDGILIGLDKEDLPWLAALVGFFGAVTARSIRERYLGLLSTNRKTSRENSEALRRALESLRLKLSGPTSLRVLADMERDYMNKVQ
jgi:hypothetical protein